MRARAPTPNQARRQFATPPPGDNLILDAIYDIARVIRVFPLPQVPQSRSPERRSLVALSIFAICTSACSTDQTEPSPQGPNDQALVAKHQALGPGSNTAPYAHEMIVTVPFAAQIGGQDIKCGQRYAGVGLANSEVEFEELALYLHKVSFKNAQGSWVPLRMQDDGRWQSKGVALLDFLDHGSAACAAQGSQDKHQLLSGYLPKGQYSAIRYTLGVPGVLNHIDASRAQSPFNRQRMWWTWSRGYRYLKADLKSWTKTQDGNTIHKPRYFSHSGANKCALDPVTKAYTCKDPRLVEVELPLNPERQGIVVDMTKYLARDDLSKGRGCMGSRSVADKADPKGTVSDSCVGHYLSMGLNTSGELATPSGTQDLFRVVDWAGQKPAAPQTLTLAQVDTAEGRKNVHHWPRKDYVRPAGLDDGPSASAHGATESHPFDDPRSAQSCSNCHQTYGPGQSIYSFAGTIFREDGTPYNEGFVEIVSSTGKPNRREPDPGKKLQNPVVHMRIPIDGYGQFYATQDLANQYATQNNVAPLDFAKTNYQAYVVNRDGHRVQAMAVKTTGSCSHCHTGSFKLTMPDRLLSGPWTPEP